LPSSNNATYASFADAMLPHTKNTYWHEFGEISNNNVSLNYFEKLWAAWYAYMGNDILATGIMSFVMHETVYFGRSLPWIIIDQIPAFNKYKIQNVSLQLVLLLQKAIADFI
jgi:methylsterol monooxygenase